MNYPTATAKAQKHGCAGLQVPQLAILTVALTGATGERRSAGRRPGNHQLSEGAGR